MSATLQLNDGTTTIDLLAAPYFASAAAVVGADESARLARRGGGPRTFEIAMNPRASGGASLRDAIRALEAVCAKAESRAANGVGRATLRRGITGGADAAAEFGVLRGEVELSPAFMGEPALSAASAAPGTTLRLLAEPFGTLAAVSPQPVSLVNEQDGANRNYLDFTNIPGTSGAKLQLKIEDGGDTWSGSGKMWIAKRSGERRADALFFQAQDGVSAVGDSPMTLGPHIGSAAVVADGLASGGRVSRIEWRSSGRFHLLTDFTLAGHVRISVSGGGLPRGLFRVLARCRPAALHMNYDESETMGFALGWRIGARSKTPGEADAVYPPSGAKGPGWEIYDLGEILIDPPVPPGGYAAPALDLNVYAFHKGPRRFQDTSAGRALRWDVDFAALIPVDEGAAIVNAVGADDAILLDAMGDAPGVYLPDAANVAREFADFAGAPFTIGPDDTRVYILRDDAGDPSAVSFLATAKYAPLVAAV